MFANDPSPKLSDVERLFDASRTGDMDEFNTIVAAKTVDINYSGEHDITPLMIAAKYDQKRIVARFIEEGADLDKVDYSRATASHYAIQHKHFRIFKMLHKAGAKIDVADDWGQTLLMIAAHYARKKSVVYLLKHGADVNALCTHSKFSALRYAICSKNNKCVPILIKAGADVNALCGEVPRPIIVDAANSGFVAHTNMLLANGANVNAVGADGTTALLDATAGNHVEMMMVLLNAGASIDARDTHDRTALWYATYHGFSDAAILLIARGADPNLADNHNNTPLMCAAAKGHAEIVKILLSSGAKTDVTCKQGFNARNLAYRNSHFHVVELFTSPSSVCVLSTLRQLRTQAQAIEEETGSATKRKRFD